MLLLPNDTAGVAVVDFTDPSKPLRIGNVDTVGIPAKGEQLQFYDNNITIDASNAGVIIDGSHGADDVSGLRINTSGNVIKGLKIQNFNGGGIKVAGSNNLIGGSRLTGAGPVGEGNTIISNKWFSIIISGQQSNDNIIAGNNVGVDSDGTTPAGNNMGISVDSKASRNIIGIEHSEYRNIISGNKEAGINARGIGTFIQGNYLGTDISGTKAIGNSGPGIAIDVGGFGSIVRNNVICDNREGVLIWDGGSNYNVVVSNSIGLGADGKTHIPNRQGAFHAGGGVGGGTCFNIFGSGRENLSNKVFSPFSEDIGSFRGVYDLIYNGRVCKYGGSDRY